MLHAKDSMNWCGQLAGGVQIQECPCGHHSAQTCTGVFQSGLPFRTPGFPQKWPAKIMETPHLVTRGHPPRRAGPGPADRILGAGRFEGAVTGVDGEPVNGQVTGRVRV